jgi:hypothetical protein
MTAIYCIIIEDHHTDIEVLLRSSESVALLEAKELALKYDRFGDYEEYVVDRDMLDQGRLFYATYSCEGDSVSVIKREVE